MNDGKYRAKRLPLTRRQVRATAMRHLRRHADALAQFRVGVTVNRQTAVWSGVIPPGA